MGVGNRMIIGAIKGVDMFDCVLQHDQVEMDKLYFFRPINIKMQNTNLIKPIRSVVLLL